MSSCQSTSKCGKDHTRCKAFKIKEERKRKKSTAAQEEMRKIREEIDRNEERKQVDCCYGTRSGEV